MNTTPIICQGDELEGVLADICERGGIVTALSTGVGGNAGYSVSYFGCVAENTDAGAGSSRIPVRQLTAHAGENPVATNPFPHQGETPANPETPEAVTLPHCPTCSGPVTQGMACPICAGLERIKAGARRLRNRFRPSTREARMPYAND